MSSRRRSKMKAVENKSGDMDIVFFEPNGIPEPAPVLPGPSTSTSSFAPFIANLLTQESASHQSQDGSNPSATETETTSGGTGGIAEVLNPEDAGIDETKHKEVTVNYAKEMRRRTLLCVLRIFKNEVSPEKLAAEGLDDANTTRIRKLLECLEQSLDVNPLMHCNLLSFEPLNSKQEILDFTDALYPSLATLLLVQQLDFMHDRIFCIIERLLLHLQENDLKVCQRALRRVLSLVNEYNGDLQFRLQLTAMSSVHGPRAIAIDIPAIYEQGFARILQIVYPFWNLNNFNGTEISGLFLKCIRRTWQFSEDNVRCNVLVGFPQHLLLQDAENQAALLDLVEEVFNHLIRFGWNLQAELFLDQMWTWEICDNSEPMGFLTFRICEILLDLVSCELNSRAISSKVKKFIVYLLIRIKNAFDGVNNSIQERLDVSVMENWFNSNPSALNLLANIIHEECVNGFYNSLNGVLKLETSEGDCSSSETIDHVTMTIQLEEISETWATISGRMNATLESSEQYSMSEDQKEVDERFIKASLQGLEAVTLLQSVFDLLFTQTKGKSNKQEQIVIAFNSGKLQCYSEGLFNQTWTNLLSTGLQMTSREAMNDIMKMAIKMMQCLSSPNLYNVMGKADFYDDFKIALLFFFSASWSPEELFNGVMKSKNLVLATGKWRCVDLSEEELLQNCVSVLSLQIFDRHEETVYQLLLHALDNPSCIGLVKGTLEVLGEVTQVTRRLGIDTIQGCLTRCCKQLSNVWRNREDIELLLVKAFVRLACHTMSSGSSLNARGCMTCLRGSIHGQLEDHNSDNQDIWLVMFAQPFFRSQSAKVKQEMLRFLTLFRNHSRPPKMTILKYFCSLFSDATHDIRKELLIALCCYLEFDPCLGPYPEGHHENIDYVFKALQWVCGTLDRSNYYAGVISVANGLMFITRTPDPYIRQHIIKIIVQLMSTSNSRKVPAVLVGVFQSLAERRGLDSPELMGQQRHFISREFVKIYLEIGFKCPSLAQKRISLEDLCKEPSENEQGLIQSSCDAVKRLFFLGGYKDKSLFLSHFGGQIILQVLSKVPLVRSRFLFLHGVAKFVDPIKCSITGLLVDYFAIYYPYFASIEKKYSERIMKFLEKMNVDRNFVGKFYIQSLHNEIAMHLSTNTDEIYEAFRMVLCWISEVKSVSFDFTKDKILDSISKHLPGLYVFVQNQLNNRSTPLEFKKRILGSLTILLDHFKQHHLCTTTKFKLYVVLSSFSNVEPELHAPLFNVWLAFVKQLTTEECPDMIVQILAATAQLNPKNKETQYNFLLSSLYEFRKSGFLTAIPQLHFVEDYLETYVKEKDVLKLIPKGKDLFNQLLKQICHFNSYVRYQAIKKLRDVLDWLGVKDCNNIGIHDRILETTEIHVDIWKLLVELMKNARGKVDRVNELATECIGLIGAVDPFRMSTHQNFDKFDPSALDVFDVLSAPFLAIYLDKLSQLLQGAIESSDFDDYAYTIQKVLQHYQVKPDTRHKVWMLLSNRTRSVVEPMFESKYNVKHEIEPTCSYPIFGSEKGRTFHDWACHFIIKLVSVMKPNVTSQSAKTLFDLSKLVATRCPDFAFFILPHLIFYAVRQCCKEELQAISSEFQLVMTGWIPTVCPTEKVYTKMDHSRRKSIDKIGVVRKEDPVVAENLRCTNVVFSISDHLTQAIGHYIALRLYPHEIEKLQLVCLPKMVLSRAAFGTDSYHRALKHAEEAIADGSESLQGCLSYLQRMYVALDDIDSIAGVSALTQSNSSRFENIISTLAQGRREEAASEFQRIYQDEPDLLVGKQGLIQAYLLLDQPQLAYNLLEGYFRPSEMHLSNELASTSQTSPLRSDIILEECMLEACWRLEKWEELDALFKTTSSNLMKTWEGRVSRALYYLEKAEYPRVLKVLEDSRPLFVAPLAAIENDWDAYVGRYSDIVRIHILCEVNQIVELLESKEGSRDFDDPSIIQHKLDVLLTAWRKRLKVVQNTISVVDPIINVRKVLLRCVKRKFKNHTELGRTVDLEIVDYLLKIAELEWADRNHTRATTCISEAAKFSPLTFLHEAKFLTAAGDENAALAKLKKGLDLTYFKESNRTTILKHSSAVKSHQDIYAESLLIYAKLNDKLCHVDVSENITNYENACKAFPNEDNFFNLAKYLEKIPQDISCGMQPLERKRLILQNYCNSLKNGCNNVYQSLPRLLSIWFEVGQQVTFLDPHTTIGSEEPPAKRGRKSIKQTVHKQTNINDEITIESKRILQEMTSSIDDLLANIPSYVFLTVFSQLASRLCHNNTEVWEMLKQILGKITCDYPDQTTWMLSSVRNSSFKERKGRYNILFNYACQKSSRLRSIARDCATLTEQLIMLSRNSKCDHDKHKPISLNHLQPSLENLFTKSNQSKILVPVDHFLSVSLPVGNDMRSHTPFPSEVIYIVGIEERVEIMSSLQRPKKIVFRGSNGKSYGVMCKPNDDLRKDSKMMEFNGVVNKYLMRTTETSQRNLRIRTYAVTPLTETCGLVEWINNLQSYSHLLTNLYKECGMRIDHSEVRNIRGNLLYTSSFEKKKEVFEKLVQLHPEILGYWFKRRFTNPHTWYKARLNFVRTAAVMSVVGVTVGLGDRHGENILIDTRIGDLVHVDFNCIFNKGETFQWMERVPFRLTRNLIHGFGPLGYEGVFRKTSEVTLQMLRDNMDVFLSTMEPFVFDPLVEWSTTINTGMLSNDSEGKENDNVVAKKHLNDIKLKLLGEKRNLSKNLDLRLSTKAHINYLIQEASDIRNLCQMYPGWAPYL